MKAFGMNGGWASVTANTRLTIMVPPDDKTCDRASLNTIRKGLKSMDIDLKALGFDSMQCDIDGTVLRL